MTQKPYPQTVTITLHRVFVLDEKPNDDNQELCDELTIGIPSFPMSAGDRLVLARLFPNTGAGIERLLHLEAIAAVLTPTNAQPNN